MQCQCCEQPPWRTRTIGHWSRAIEPSTLHTHAPDGLTGIGGDGAERLRIVIEVTERSVAARPAELLWTASWIRDQGWGIALDDVGARTASLALMPFLRPEIIKLDLSLSRSEPSADAVRILGGVLAEAEATGAQIVAEGIETPEHLERALALGRPWARVGSSAGRARCLMSQASAASSSATAGRPTDTRGCARRARFRARSPRRAAKRWAMTVQTRTVASTS